MIKKLLLFITLISAGFKGYTQDVTKDEAAKLQLKSDELRGITADSVKNWKFGGVVSFNGQQVALSNWAAGGTNSVSFGGIFSVYARYKKGKSTWDSNLDLGYGVIKQGNNKKFWKTDDRIQLTSKYGREAFNNKKCYYTALADFKTQFANGYNYPNDTNYISRFMAPAYLIAALGMDFKPNDNLSIFIAPVTGKFTYVNSDSLAKLGAYGVQKQITDGAGNITQNYLIHREELGAYLKLQYQVKVMDNVTFQTMVELFSNYLHHPENIDVNWTTLTTFKVNKFISATLTTQLIYDDDIKLLRTTGDKKGTSGPDIQFKQVLGVGLNYKF